MKEKLSKEKLQALINSSYMTNEEAKKVGKTFGFKLVKKLSSREQKVYLDNEGNPFIAYTGSRKFEDFAVSDAALLTGFHGFTPRFRKSKALADKVRNRYHKPITMVGHSLGGSLSEYSSKPDDNVITINKGAGLTQIGKKINNNQTDLRSPTDIVSVFSNSQRGGRKIDIDGSFSLNPLLSHNASHVSKLRNDYWNIGDSRVNNNNRFRDEL
jgi:hypothetical protein